MLKTKEYPFVILSPSISTISRLLIDIPSPSSSSVIDIISPEPNENLNFNMVARESLSEGIIL